MFKWHAANERLLMKCAAWTIEPVEEEDEVALDHGPMTIEAEDAQVVLAAVADHLLVIEEDVALNHVHDLEALVADVLHRLVADIRRRQHRPPEKTRIEDLSLVIQKGVLHADRNRLSIRSPIVRVLTTLTEKKEKGTAFNPIRFVRTTN